MIHFENTLIANAAMMSARRLGCHAPLAHADHVFTALLGRTTRIGYDAHHVVKHSVHGDPMTEYEVANEIQPGGLIHLWENDGIEEVDHVECEHENEHDEKLDIYFKCYEGLKCQAKRFKDLRSQGT